MLGQHWTETTYVDEAIMTSIHVTSRMRTGLKCTEMILDLSTAKLILTAISPSFTASN
jgi:hypothetical protein